MENIPQDSYLLVSDSNESGNQFDSKKIPWETLVELAQDSLFKKHLDIMDSYLTRNQVEAQKTNLEWLFGQQQEAFGVVEPDDGSKRKLKVVDGQIILLDADTMDEIVSKTHVSLLEYIKQYWDITQDFSISQIHDCMLRGITDITDKDSPTSIKRASNTEVGLTKETIPSHMHHSGITQGAKVGCMTGSTEESDNLSVVESGTSYDMFYNDSFSTGLQRNELDGVYDNFRVQPAGVNVAGENDEPRIMHNNLPVYRKYYAFLIRKISI